MFFIELADQYRVEANELVKLFLPGDCYTYIDISPDIGTEPDIDTTPDIGATSDISATPDIGATPDKAVSPEVPPDTSRQGNEHDFCMAVDVTHDAMKAHYFRLEDDKSKPSNPQFAAIRSEDILLQFTVKLSADNNFLHGYLLQDTRVLYHEELPIVTAKSEQNKNVKMPQTFLVPVEPHAVSSLNRNIKMPLKFLIYRLLSAYTGMTLPWGALTGIRPAKLVNTLLQQGEDFDAIYRKFTDYYKVSAEKTRLAIKVAVSERPYLASKSGSISIYIGIPFCTSRCLYCSFPSVSTQRYGSYITDYLNALEKEVQWTAAWMKEHDIILDTVYIGGGTPTALPEEDLKRLLDSILPILPMDKAREHTVEAGRPDTINREKLQIMKRAGVSRISINPQTMQDKTLRLIGRNHTAQQCVEAFHMARAEGFNNINCDLIAGLPEETLEDFTDTFDKIKELSPESVTVHTMSVKRASRLNEEKDQFTNTPDDIVATMVDMAGARAREMGLRPYYLYRQKNILANLENVGYAKPGFEGIYNILIMEEIQTILALGAGATSKIVYPDKHIKRIFNVRNVEQYIQRIDEMIKRKADLLDYAKI